MDTRVRTGLRTTKTPPKQQQIDRAKAKEKEKIEMSQRNGEKMEAGKTIKTSRSRKERRIALQQEVDKLKKKLRHEENVHRALERAFSRPLGSLPRLPPYLPRYTLELLAEVAVLEEEVVRLEEQVVDLRQGLYQEAIYMLSSKKTDDNASDLTSNSDAQSPPVQNGRSPNGKKSLNKPSSCSPVSKEQSGKENHLDSHSSKTTNTKQSPKKKSETNRTSGFKKQVVDKQLNYKGSAKKNVADVTVNGVGGSSNRISEDTLKCLLGIFSQKDSLERTGTEPESTPSTSGCDEDLTFQDPYSICSQFGRRDVGPYKSFLSIDENSIDQNLIADSPLLLRKLKLLLKKLEMVDLRGLNHPQKLAFWINIYNSCMMNAILENGIPSSPQMVAALMPKATIKVGGHLFSAMTIEHFILRLPYQSKEGFPKGYRNNQMIARSVLGLDWPEPMVTFALSCGSWSSPAVRVYTPSQVENELETAKRDYLQAAVGISATNKLAIPKLLDWYLHDFAKDVESLMDWICLQLPSGLRNDAVMCIERARRGAVQMQNVPVLPYDFRFSWMWGRENDTQASGVAAYGFQFGPSRKDRLMCMVEKSILPPLSQAILDKFSQDDQL